MSDNQSWLVAGLGNPGLKYADTRHNIGFMVVDRLADILKISLRKRKFNSLFGTGSCNGTGVILAEPQSYMNCSGPPIIQLARYYKLETDHVLIVHDDVDILFGNLKIKAKGGHGGHNGLRSIIDAAGSNDFPRIRVGIGRPEAHNDMTDHVLGKFSAEELPNLETIITHAAKAAQTVINKGLLLSMNRFNRNGVGSDKL